MPSPTAIETKVRAQLRAIKDTVVSTQLLAELKGTKREASLIAQLNAQGAEIVPHYWNMTACSQPDGLRHLLGFKAKGSSCIYDTASQAIGFAIHRLISMRGSRIIHLEIP